LPPLREREGDTVLLANFFLKKYAAQYKMPAKGFTSEAILALQGHEWTGNVRELENKVKRAVVMADGAQVRPEDLDLQAREIDVSLSLRDIRRRAERTALEIALAQSPGNMAKVAKLLEISRPTLYDLLNEHGLTSATRSKAREGRETEG
jgi:two-component system NtrC family response regulator